jgi:DNA (cytosine-5)-methyltransferase 1
VVNAAEYGFPQRRIRVFIVAQRVDTNGLHEDFEPAALLERTGVLAQALPICPIQELLRTVDVSAEPDVLTSEFNVGGGKSPFASAGVCLNGVAYTAKIDALQAKEKLTLGDALQADSEIPDEYWIDSSRLPEWEYLKGAKTIERTHKGSGATYNYAEGKMAFPDLLSNPSRTILTGEGGTSPSRFKHIIKVDGGYRRLTPVELERLNGFPDDWTKFDSNGNQISDVRRAFFMGNALVIGLVERVGAELASRLSSE